jgi:glycosyltransferase involved in cell wall biosynthesis
VSPGIENMEIKTSFLQKIPGILDKYRNFLPLFPVAIESFDLTGYDLVLSSSHCVAKGVKPPEGSFHICYCHTPVRYAWRFFDEYFSGEPLLKKWFIRGVVKNLKKWDLKSNNRVDRFIAISEYIKDRIKDCYNRTSDVIYPPVDTETSFMSEQRGDYYLIVSALVPYKRVDLAVETFALNGKPLIIIGTGSDIGRIKSLSRGVENITLKGWVEDSELKEYFSKCKALIFPGEEDFGIVPLEAQAFGKPVVAYHAGGAVETVVPFNEGADNTGRYPTGVFFKEQSTAALNAAINLFEANIKAFSPCMIRENALRFGKDRYKKEIQEYISEKFNDFKGKVTL